MRTVHGGVPTLVLDTTCWFSTVLHHVVVIPVPESVLVEDDITRHMNPAISWIVESIRLSSSLARCGHMIFM
jgi:hypothetical protein